MGQESLFEKDEIVIEKIRKHFIVYVGDFLAHSFGGLFFMGLAYILTHVISVPFFSQALAAHVALVLIAIVILFWTSFFYSWTISYLDIWYVTNQHIIAINQKELFEREESFMELNRIQDVFFEKNSFLSTLLGYGKLKVQSAGTEQEFIIEGVRDVELAAHRIMELRDDARKGAVLVPSIS
jgi:uncharacterized membrane protein YdbT with pleckstrin-like domain